MRKFNREINIQLLENRARILHAEIRAITTYIDEKYCIKKCQELLKLLKEYHNPKDNIKDYESEVINVAD